MTHPLRFDPGTKWIYGLGIDWVSINKPANINTRLTIILTRLEFLLEV
jgi:hypothetical protein